MAVQENKSRRLDHESEKLLTLEEAAKRLGLPPDDAEALIQKGRLPSFRLGGNFLRVRLKDVESVQAQLLKARAAEKSKVQPAGSSSAAIAPLPKPPESSASERLSDFFYFNDFYLLAFLVALVLLAIIVVF